MPWWLTDLTALSPHHQHLSYFLIGQVLTNVKSESENKKGLLCKRTWIFSPSQVV